MRARLFPILLVSSLALAACTSNGHPPTARIAPTPAYLDAGDGYRTDLLLDGSASRNDLDDPEGTMPLSYDWSIDDPAPQIVDGDLHRASLTVRLAAARPTTVSLTVTDPAGDSGTATIRIGINLPE